MKILSRTVGLFEENSYLVIDEPSGHAVLIDPGDEPDRLIAMVRDSGAVLDAIWLTHAHLDHIGAVEGIRRAWPVPVSLHPADRPLFDRAMVQAELYGVPFEQPGPPDAELAEGDRMRVGASEFGVLHLPGHAPGHVIFLGDGVIFGGDVLFAGSVGRTDLPLSDSAAMQHSLARIVELEGSLIVHPGHGPATTIGAERATNPFLAGLPHRIPPVTAPPRWAMALDSALLSAWLGSATLFAAVVAPAAFAVLPSRTIAGNVIGAVLPTIFYTGIVIAVASVALSWPDRRTSLPRWRRLCAGAIAIPCAIAQLVIGGRIERVRAGISGAVDALAPSDPRRIVFGELHAASVGCLGVAMVATVVSIVLAARSSAPTATHA